MRAQLHAMWGSVSAAWGEHAEYVDAREERVTELMLELAAPRPGEQVLELACGAGGLGMDAAERVGADGSVVLSDVAAEMTAIAGARAGARGLDNVSSRVLDLESIDEPDGAFDVVLCREGLMLAVDPAGAAREMRRVLRPGGRLAIAVWGPREQNPWLGTVLDAVGAQLGAPVPPPGVPGPFALSDAGELASLLTGAGLSGVEVRELALPVVAESFEEWWERTSALAGPVALMLAQLPPETVGAIRDRAAEAFSAYATGDRYELPGLTLVAGARRAG